MNDVKVYFPINQREQAVQDKQEVLLADEVYSKLTDTIKVAQQRAHEARHRSNGTDDVNEDRAHNAVLIDGSRGTGKSSVLVNMAHYLEHNDRTLADRIHILKPLDPTLLETTDDLFLNVIVAGLVCDRKVQQAKECSADNGAYFNEQLQKLGNILERLESQRELRGLDKLRAFMGNQNLAQQVHMVFKAALAMLGKDLLVLPIDDVDTSLNRAFDNLEVIRKYLVSPYVLPVISGDLSLYNDLTWRNFHGKLLKESTAERGNALSRAKDLAQEYQRKVLPLQYRIEMPEVLSYLKSTSIGFYDAESRPINGLTMGQFYSWLETLLNERTNGAENSYIAPPVKNVRALAQLIYSLKAEIPKLATVTLDARFDKTQLRRQFVMPMPSGVIQSFAQQYAAAMRISDKSQNEKGRRDAYTRAVGAEQEHSPLYRDLRALARSSRVALMQYCQFAPEAGAAYLTLAAQQYWDKLAASESHPEFQSVLNAALFEPMAHTAGTLRQFNAAASTSSWTTALTGRAPDEWLARLPRQTIVPYPPAEAGYALSKMSEPFADASTGFAAALLVHRNFYTKNKLATLVCCGRIFELIVASFVKDVTSDDIAHILQRAPFHSFNAVASTKTQSIGTDEPDAGGDTIAEDDHSATLHMNQVEQLASKIAQWRSMHQLATHIPSPWFFYNVMNKVFNQAPIFNAPQGPNSNPDSNGKPYLATLAPKIFNCIWAAVGSFEKGELFGLPNVIAQVNVGDGKQFRNSELYIRNIAPFSGTRTGADEFGKAVGSYTFMLASHPLKALLDNVGESVHEAKATIKGNASMSVDAEILEENTLLDFLNSILNTSYTRFRTTAIVARLVLRKDRKRIVAEAKLRYAHDKNYQIFAEAVRVAFSAG